MSSPQASIAAGRRPLAGRRLRLGDRLLETVAAVAAAVGVVLVGLIAWKLVTGARPAIDRFGLGFVWRVGWDPAVSGIFGAGSFLFGTAVTSLVALALAAPLAIAIALYLSELAPRLLRGPIAALVETLAAVPSVVIGLLGILVLGPALRDHVEPWLHRTLGFLPLLGPPDAASSGLFTAIVVLATMILPIVASISRELFLGVPRELEEGALALGTTRWETIRGVVLPYARGGIAAALILGLGRALGEAIAVTQVIGGGVAVHANLFASGDTLASKIAASYQGATSRLEVASLVYLALILLAFSLLANLGARLIVRRVSQRDTTRRRSGAAR